MSINTPNHELWVCAACRREARSKDGFDVSCTPWVFRIDPTTVVRDLDTGLVIRCDGYNTTAPYEGDDPRNV